MWLDQTTSYAEQTLGSIAPSKRDLHRLPTAAWELRDPASNSSNHTRQPPNHPKHCPVHLSGRRKNFPVDRLDLESEKRDPSASENRVSPFATSSTEMKFPAFLPVAILALLGMASAVDPVLDVVFFAASTYEGSNCRPMTDVSNKEPDDLFCLHSHYPQHVGCYDGNAGHCCRSADPFCVTAALLDVNGLTHTTYATNSSNCAVSDKPKNYDRCISSVDCCLFLTGLERHTEKCSAF